jgi:predicted ribosomally synthesized peptide with SipW-like signal peptide
MKKIGLIALIVVLSLGIIGVGYAAWSANLTVNGQVKTGSFNVTIAGGTPILPNTYTTVTYGSTTGVDGNNCPLSITLNLVAPGTYVIPLTIHNLSTIPVNITGDSVTGITDSLSDPNIATDFTVTTTHSLNGADLAASGTATDSVTIVVGSAAMNSDSYSFTIAVAASQGS